MKLAGGGAQQGVSTAFCSPCEDVLVGLRNMHTRWGRPSVAESVSLHYAMSDLAWGVEGSLPCIWRAWTFRDAGRSGSLVQVRFRVNARSFSLPLCNEQGSYLLQS